MRLLSVLISTILVVVALGDEHSHTYKDGDEVVLWMNTVGPYHNRQETYRYYLLPFCRGPRKEIGHYHETLGEELQGVELDYSGLDITFKGTIPSTPYCSVQLTKSHFNAFKYAIVNHYWYQMYIDELPMWAVVGEIDDTTQDFTIFTHRKIDIGYNGDQIVDINVTTQSRTPIIIDGEITFTYEVNWKISTISFDKRFDKYLDSSFFQHRIHWFSIFNSFMMVIFLVGLVTMIMLRTLNKDYARYSKFDDGEMDADMTDDYGWKQIHGDVFRAPPNLIIFTSLIGTGHHLAIVSFGCIVFALNGDFYKQRGSFLNTAIFMYAMTSPICGYVGGALYSKMGGRHWIRQLIGGACLFPSLLVGVALLINTIALFYHASRAFPLSSMIIVTAIALFVIFPLNLAGTLFGRNISGQPNVPCRINTVPRPLPVKKWFMEPFSLSLLGGILPFGSIFIEIYFIFTSFWQYKIYYVFGFMLLVFLILIIVTVCVTIVCIYFLLNSEDYRWQWTSFGAGFTVSFYIIIYSIYYYFFKTKMYGLFQTAFYFGYSTLGAISIGIICGTFGYIGASKFVHKIYTTVKID